jgi:DNA-binding LytR/AlgR family response regulator
MTPPALRTLVVDDEQPVLDELVWMLGRDDRVLSVRAARSGAEALRVLDEGDIDVVFLDVAMPGLSGLEIARLLGRFRTPPQIVFVTAHDELGGVTRFVSRGSVSYVEAQGDYVRLHVVDGGSHLVRTPLTTLAEDWAEAGFARVHRSHVVNLAHVRELRVQGGRSSVLVPAGDRLVEIQVARRHARALRELIHQRAL